MTDQSGAGAEVATTARTFGYDLAGRATSFSGPGGGNTLTYDDRGLLLSTSGGSGSSTFTYNGDGKMTSRTDAAGATTYTYDPAGRLQTVANPTASVAATLRVQRPVAGQPDHVRVVGEPPGVRLLAAHRADQRRAQDLRRHEYRQDRLRVRRERQRDQEDHDGQFAGSSTNIYTYDLANRLTSWNNGTTLVEYAYDKSGNRIQAGTQEFTYDQRNQLKTSSGSVTYSYTPRGTLSAVSTLGTSTVYTRTDAFGQVKTQFATPTEQRDYDYDALGRVAHAGGAYTGIGNQLASDGTSTYVRDPRGALAGVATGADKRLAWTDLHTDVVGQFTATGTTLAGSRTYDPLGKVAASTSMLGNLGYQSEYADTTTGRVNMLSRWYNTATGQFDTRDTISAGASPASVTANRFAYGDANPLTNTDPTGHCAWYNVGCQAKKVLAPVANVAKKAWNATTSVASNLYDRGRNFLNSAKNFASNLIDKGRQFVNTVVDKGKQFVNKVVNKGAALVNKGKQFVQNSARYLAEKGNAIKEQFKQTYNGFKQKATQVLVQAQRTIVQIGNTIEDTTKAVGNWIVENKDVLLEGLAIAGSIAAGLACTAVTGGVGAVACMVGAAALINLAKDYGQGDIQNWGDAFESAGIGAATGLLGGGAGMLGGKLAIGLGSRLGTGLIARTAGGFMGGAAGDGIGGAAISATTQLISTGRVDGRRVLNDAAFSAGTGGLMGAGAGLGSGIRASRNPQPQPGCRTHSFSPGTKVLMADGSAKPIEDVRVGDKVKATDPETGVTAAKPVTMLHLNRDRDLTDVTVAAAPAKAASSFAGRPLVHRVAALVATVAAAAAIGTAVLHTTEHHPFWDEASSTWVDAADLQAGRSILRTADGQQIAVVGVADNAGDQLMHDLTVADIHTYYVLAGDTPVLVHNTGGEQMCRFHAGVPGASQSDCTPNCTWNPDNAQTVARVEHSPTQQADDINETTRKAEGGVRLSDDVVDAIRTNDHGVAIAITIAAFGHWAKEKFRHLRDWARRR